MRSAGEAGQGAAPRNSFLFPLNPSAVGVHICAPSLSSPFLTVVLCRPPLFVHNLRQWSPTVRRPVGWRRGREEGGAEQRPGEDAGEERARGGMRGVHGRG